MEDEKAAKFRKSTYKKYIKKVIAENTFKYLLKIKEKHSKLKDIIYTKFKLQNYLKSNNNLTYEQKSTLFKFRVREIEVKNNYKNKYPNQKCNLCTSNEDDTQYHLLQCEYLIRNCAKLANNVTIEYEDIFEDSDKQLNAAKLLHEVWEKRTELTFQ